MEVKIKNKRPAKEKTNESESKRSKIDQQVQKVKTTKRKKIVLSQSDLLRVAERPKDAGWVLSMGQGDTGQLGLGADVMEATRPKKVLVSDNIVQISAGGMHSLCLSSDGEVWSFGCNDEATLGRTTENEEDCFVPAKISGFKDKIVQICAGDSHSVALDEQGRVYVWGTFRDHSGVIGMNSADEEVQKRKWKKTVVGSECKQVPTPAIVASSVKMVAIASGYSHVLCLSEDGDVYSFGAADFGQLGRVRRNNCEGGRHNITKNNMLTPGKITLTKGARCTRIWAGGYASFALTNTEKIFAWGLNNYYQLGFADMDERYFPEESSAFEGIKTAMISASEHHIITLDQQHQVLALGRGTYGRLGVADDDQDVKKLTVVRTFEEKKVTSVACGLAVSFAIDGKGEVYSWGMGSNNQLGHGDDDADVKIPATFAPKQMKNLKGLQVSAGAQHTLLLVHQEVE